MAGATAITMEMLPIMAPRVSDGTSLITVVISRGIITAVPEACTMRPISSTGKPGASAHTTVPRVKVVMAIVNTWRVVSRSSSHPVTGITTAIVSRNAVVSHCAVRSVTPSEAMMLLSATFIVVSLRMTTKAATIRTPMTPLGASGPGAAADMSPPRSGETLTPAGLSGRRAGDGQQQADVPCGWAFSPGSAAARAPDPRRFGRRPRPRRRPAAPRAVSPRARAVPRARRC